MVQISKILHLDLAQRKSKNSSYSMRAYARYLGISPTSLSLVLKGKRSLSPKALKNVLPKLNISVEQHTALLNHRAQKSDQEFHEVDLQKLRLISDWYYFAVLSLMELPAFKEDPVWIAKRLNIKVWQASAALDHLEQLAMVRRTNRGKLVPSGENFKSPDQVPSQFIKVSHIQALELARYSLENDPIDKRNFSAMTMAIDSSLIPEAAKRIGKFRRKLSLFLESGTNKDQVYRLSLQLFPLSREN